MADRRRRGREDEGEDDHKGRGKGKRRIHKAEDFDFDPELFGLGKGGGGKGKRKSKDTQDYGQGAARTSTSCPFGATASDHPLGWGSTDRDYRKTARTRPGRDSAAARTRAVSLSPCRKPPGASVPKTPAAFAAQGWTEVKGAAQAAYAQYHLAASRVPVAPEAAVPLSAGLRVMVNEGGAAIVFGWEGQEAPDDDFNLDAQDVSGFPGTVVSKTADGEGRWILEVTRYGILLKVLAPAWALLWRGAEVELCNGAEPAGEQGLVAEERMDRDTGCWRVDVRKRLSLLAANLLHLGVEAGSAAKPGAVPLGSQALHRGAVVKLRDLKASASYNGMSGTVLSAAASDKGRWEVEVVRRAQARPDQMRHPGAPTPTVRPPPKPESPIFNSSDEEEMIDKGRMVMIHGLKNAPQHNCVVGMVMGVSPKDPKRWRVQCPGTNGSGPLLLDLRGENLHLQRT